MNERHILASIRPGRPAALDPGAAVAVGAWAGQASLWVRPLCPAEATRSTAIARTPPAKRSGATSSLVRFHFTVRQ
jgi:hypothetical protein